MTARPPCSSSPLIKLEQVSISTCGDYDDDIREDLGARVFIDFEVFMKSVLRVPVDWNTLWDPAIEAIKEDCRFKKYHGQYLQQCIDPALPGKSFYELLMNVVNAIVDALPRCDLSGISRGSQYHHHQNCLLPGANNLYWANPLHVLEAGQYGNTLCDGKNMPRLTVDGVDPISNHALYRSPPQRNKKKSSTTSSEPTSSKLKRRRAERSQISSEAARKRARTDYQTESSLSWICSDGASDEDGEEDETSSESETESHGHFNLALHVCRYLLKRFHGSLLRSHVTTGLVDRDRLQLYHANHSVILVSSAINFSHGSGLNKFIAFFIASHCLSSQQNGILDTLVNGNANSTENSENPQDDELVQGENQLKLPVAGSREKFTVTLGDVISHDPSVIGKSTVVLKGKSDEWPKNNFVVKISWPDSNCVSENEFLEKAMKEAEKTGEGWATNHLPRFFYFEDVDFGKDSVLESVANLFEDTEVVGGKYVYKRRTLRIIVQEELYPFESLSNARDVGQVFLDIACIHRWLYDKPGILHRDLSPHNIMYRILEDMDASGEEQQRKIYGVLTDFDLSSWTKDLKIDCPGTSKECIGTPPYMAHELLMGDSTTHLYKHDVESFFDVMLLTCGRHTFGDVKDGVTGEVTRRVVTREGKLPYQDWFDEQHDYSLGICKWDFILKMKTIHLSPPFEDFRVWLQSVGYCLYGGIRYRICHPRNRSRPSWQLEEGGGTGEAEPIPPFDDETLGGLVDYSAIVGPTRHLKGEPEGLIIRYDDT